MYGNFNREEEEEEEEDDDDDDDSPVNGMGCFLFSDTSISRLKCM